MARWPAAPPSGDRAVAWAGSSRGAHHGHLRPQQQQQQQRPWRGQQQQRQQRRGRTCCAGGASDIPDQSIRVKIMLAESSGKLDLSDCGLDSVPGAVFELQGARSSWGGAPPPRVAAATACEGRVPHPPARPNATRRPGGAVAGWQQPARAAARGGAPHLALAAAAGWQPPGGAARGGGGAHHAARAVGARQRAARAALLAGRPAAADAAVARGQRAARAAAGAGLLGTAGGARPGRQPAGIAAGQRGPAGAPAQAQPAWQRAAPAAPGPGQPGSAGGAVGARQPPAHFFAARAGRPARPARPLGRRLRALLRPLLVGPAARAAEPQPVRVLAAPAVAHAAAGRGCEAGARPRCVLAGRPPPPAS